MPRIRRWFPVSQDINTDPDVWALTEKFGDRALRIWLEILSIADRSEGLITGASDQLAAVIAWRCRTQRHKVAAVIAWARDHRWLAYETVTGRPPDDCLRIVNYAKYHISRDANKIPTGKHSASLPSEPSEPSEPNSRKESDKRCNVSRESWPEPDRWLFDFLQNESPVQGLNGELTDLAWWNAVSETCGGISPDSIRTEFNRIAAWLSENPSRRPGTARGWKRFIRTWLERSYEKERREKR